VETSAKNAQGIEAMMTLVIEKCIVALREKQEELSASTRSWK